MLLVSEISALAAVVDKSLAAEEAELGIVDLSLWCPFLTRRPQLANQNSPEQARLYSVSRS